jgi:phosphatidylserine decarboxylase
MKRVDNSFIVREGYPFCILPAIAGLILAALHWFVSGAVLLAIGLFCLYFFRNPYRRIPQEPRAVIAPADGKVIQVDPACHDNRFMGTLMQKVSIFMNLFDVHVNRFPVSGTVRRIAYHPGRFFSANRDKASRENEHNALFLETPCGENILMIQIAGIVARRIVCWAEEGDRVEAGQRAGLIRFGSRVDLFLSPQCRIVVRQGERVRAGETVVGYLP